MSLSPTCTINGGPTPAVVTQSATVNGALANPAGAAFFAIRAVSADDSTSVADLATINASLSVNQTNKTFSFATLAGLGKCIIFMVTVGVSDQSVLGSGRDANGVVVPEWTETFKVNVLTAQGLAVIAANEVTEQDPVAGWTVQANATTRAIGTGGGGGGNQGLSNISLSNGLNSNVSTTGLSTLLVGGPTAAFSIDGIATTASAKAGLDLVIINTTAFQMTLVDQSTSVSTAANQIATGSGNGGNVVLKPTTGRCVLRYDTVNSRWQVISRGWETQSPTHLDPWETGAVGNGTTLSRAAIQAMLEIAGIGGQPPEVRPKFDRNNTWYRTDGPLCIRNPGTKLLGPYGAGTPGTGGNACTIGPANLSADGLFPVVTTAPQLSPDRTYAQRGSVWYGQFDAVQGGTNYDITGVDTCFLDRTFAMSGTPNLTFAAAGHTITRNVGSFVSDGFVVGQTVFVHGSASNDGVVGRLTAVSALVLTFASGIVNEGPSPSISVTAFGLLQFHYEQFFQLPAAVPGGQIWTLFGVGGGLPRTGSTQTVWVSIDSSQKITASIATSAGTVSVTSSNTVPNSASPSALGTHVSVDFDGTTGTLYVSVAGTTTASSAIGAGVIRQRTYEHTTIGALYGRFLRAFILRPCTASPGIYYAGGFKVGKAAVYTASFTPPTVEPSCDGNSSGVWSYAPKSSPAPSGAYRSDFHNRFLVGMAGWCAIPGFGRFTTGSPVWIKILNVSLGNLANVEIGHLTLFCQDTALEVDQTVDSSFHDLYFNGGQRGVTLSEFSYENRFNAITVSTGSGLSGNSWSIGVMANGGRSYFEKFNFLNSPLYQVATCAGGVFEGAFCGGMDGNRSVQNVFLAILGADGRTNDLRIRSWSPSDEGSFNPSIASAIFEFDTVGNVDMRDCDMAVNLLTAPAVKINNIVSGRFAPNNFGGSPSSPGIFAITNQTAPIRFDGWQFDLSPEVPWLDPANAGPLVHESHMLTRQIITTTADADVTIAPNDSFYGHLIGYDPGNWTGPHNFILPYAVAGIQLTVTSPAIWASTWLNTNGYGVTVPAGKTCVIESDGVGWYEISTSATTVLADPKSIFKKTRMPLLLDTRFGVTLQPTDSTKIATLADQSGNGHDATQGLGSAPLYFANGGVKNRPYIQNPTGQGKFLANVAANLVAAGAARTVYIVAELTGGTNAVLLDFRTSNPELSLYAHAAGNVVAGDGGGHSFQSTTMPTSGKHIYKFSFTTGLAACTVSVDGVAQTVTGPTPSALSTDSGGTGYRIFTNVGGAVFEGKLYFMCVVDESTTPVSGTEDTQMMAYLTANF